MPRNRTKEEPSLAYLIVCAYRIVDQQANRLLRSHKSNLSVTEFAIMNFLHDNGPLGILELASHSEWTYQRVMQIVERLRERGFVKESKDPKDGRRRLISLSPKGRAFAKRELPAIRRLLREDFYRNIPDKTLTNLRSALVEFLKGMRVNKKQK